MRLNLPLPDRAGRGQLEERIVKIVSDMERSGHGRDLEKFERASLLLDQCRSDFHKMYGKTEK